MFLSKKLSVRILEYQIKVGHMPYVFPHVDFVLVCQFTDEHKLDTEIADLERKLEEQIQRNAQLKWSNQSCEKALGKSSKFISIHA